MSDNPPYMNAYGQIGQVLEKIKTAKTPQRFTQDFLHIKLSVKSSSVRPIISVLKKLGFLSSDAVPTPRYDQFRVESKSGGAMATGLREAYHELYSRHEYVHELSSKELKDLVIEATGLETNSGILKAIVSTFEALKLFAIFDLDTEPEGDHEIEDISPNMSEVLQKKEGGLDLGMNLSYTINLNLPETSNVAVYDAIFKSLREHMLKREG